MISKDMNLFDLLQKYPQISKVLKKYDMHCLECMGVQGETIESAARMHDIDVNELLNELYKVIKSQED